MASPGANSNIPLFYVNQYSSNIQLKLQQMGSVLRSCVMSGMHVGQQASPVDQFGAIVANKVTGRYNTMPRTDAPTDRRWVYPQDYDLNQLLDSFDKLRLLIDPMSSYVTNSMYALGRAMDLEILYGLINSNNTGNSGGTSVALPTTGGPTGVGQVVGVQTGATNSTNLTVAKLRAAKKILMSNYAIDFSSQPEIYCAINGINHDTLLSEVQVISSDFNSRSVLGENGLVQQFMGITFVHTELIQTGTDDQGGVSTAVPMWVKSGAYLGIWGDIFTDVSQRKDLQGLPYQAYVKGTFGGTRLEEKKVVQIWAH
jgi:hypothetical protein